jgi:serine/threonine protein kinase/tetratricopeptide (TPR) repeat protein
VIGQKIGRYHIVAKLGEGGMGTVWRARDEVLKRDVALKLLPESMIDSEKARRRFQGEALAASALDHPCIATIFDSGEDEGRIFIALALIEGETLNDLISRGPLSIEETVRVTRSVAGALVHAHGRGIVHRDITARNIMRAEDGRVLVLDFGLALPEGRTRITETGMVLGTLAYVAPEVLQRQEADARSDIYGLGVVLYEMLTGGLPFSGGRIEVILAAILNEEPEPPSRRRGGIPPELERIVLRTLEKNPANRYQNAVAVLTDLQELSRKDSGEIPVGTVSETETRATVTEAPTKPVHEELPSIPEAKLLAVAPFRDLSSGDLSSETAEAFARGLSETVSVSLARVPGVQVIPPSAYPQTGDGEEDTAEIARRLGATLILSGTVRRAGEKLRVTYSLLNPLRGVQIAADRVDGAVADIFAIEDQLAESVFRSLKVETDEMVLAFERQPSHDVAAHEHYLQALGYLQRYDNPASVDGAISLLTQLISSEGNSALFHAALGRAYLHKYALTHQPIWEERAAAACNRALELDPESAEVLVTMGNLYREMGEYEKAIESYQRSLESRGDDPEAYLGIATAYGATGDYEKAETAYRRAIALRPGYWAGHNKLGRFYFDRSQYDLAAEEFKRVIELTPDNARGYANLGATHFRAGNFAEATSAYHRSIEVQPNAAAYTNLGTLHFFQKNYIEAAAMFERASRLRPGDPMMWGNLGDAYRWMPGHREEATRAFESAVRTMRDQLGVNPNDGQGTAWLADWLAKLERAKEARKTIEKSLELSPGDALCMARAVTVFHLVGDRANALIWLDRALQHGFGSVEFERDPELDALRSDPSYQRIVLSGTEEGVN